MSSTPIHDPSFPSAPITLPSNLTESQLRSFPAFRNWTTTLRHSLDQQCKPSHPFHRSPYSVKSITVQAVDFFGGERLGFVKLTAEITNKDDEKLPGSVLLRGGSVAVLVLLSPEGSDDEGEVRTLLTLQPRVPAGSLAFPELPAGMLDDAGGFGGKAAKELKEETGLEIGGDDLLDLTALAIGDGEEDGERLQKGVYPSAGGCDEFIPLFVARKTMRTKEIEKLEGKLTGLRDSGEKITLKVVKLKDLWREGARDAKALSALALYQGLKAAGKLDGKL